MQVFVGYIGDKPWLDASFVYAILISISGLVMVTIPFTTQDFVIIIQTAIYGFSISANYSLVSVILVELISLDSFTTAYGMLLLVQGFGSLIGPPLAGMYLYSRLKYCQILVLICEENPQSYWLANCLIF